jgi:hypothetical protein
MDAGHAFNGADRATFAQGGDDLNLLIAGKDVHGTNPWKGGIGR